MHQVIPLHALSGEVEARFGGKAAGLARLMSLGVAVPPGLALAAELGPQALWPEEVALEVKHALLSLLAQGPVAVRSSAKGEDAEDRSFAGLFETYLGLNTEESVLEAIEKCQQSAHSPRVQAYLNGAPTPPVGVVIQQLIPARAAGVCFTRDPTGKDGALLVEAVEGLGEGLVSGQLQPQRWRVYRNGFGKLEAFLEEDGVLHPQSLPGTDGKRAVQAQADKTRVHPDSSPKRPIGHAPSTSPPALLPAGPLQLAQVLSLAEQAFSIAKQMDKPLDLEWAFAPDGGLWWLQARPITAAREPTPPVIWRAGPVCEEVTVWSNFNVRETLPIPLTPLSWSLWRDQVLPVAVESVFGVPRSSPLQPLVNCIDLVNGRLYWNLNVALGATPAGVLLRKMLPSVDAEAFQLTERLLAEGTLQLRKLPGSRLAVLWGLLKSALRVLPALLQALLPRTALKKLEKYEPLLQSFPPVESLDEQGLVDCLGILQQPVAAHLVDSIQLEVAAVGMLGLGNLLFHDHPDAKLLLPAGLACPTTEISLALDALVQSARPLAQSFSPDLPADAQIKALAAVPGGAAWVASLETFLKRYGHRGPGEFDFGSTRWYEAPEMILSMVNAGLASTETEPLAVRLDKLRARRDAAIQAAIKASPWWKRPLMRRMPRLLELYMPLREAPKHYVMFIWQRMRQAAHELGKRLVKRGILERFEDSFYLEKHELEKLSLQQPLTLDVPRAVAERKARQARFQAEPAPDHLRSDGVPLPVVAESLEVPGVFPGVGVTASEARGRVRVLLNPDPMAFQEGDILVMSFADPGWTPLFSRAGGVVMEVGGLMCHAAVVARELGVPAVFGVRKATTRLKDGQLVTVDGRKGEVRLEAEPDQPLEQVG